MSNQYRSIVQATIPTATSALYLGPATAPTITRDDGIVATNAPTTTRRTLRLFVNGSLAHNLVWLIEMERESTAICPVSIIVPSAGTIEADVDAGTDVNVSIFALVKES